MTDWEEEEFELAVREMIESGLWKVNFVENWRYVVRVVTIEAAKS